MFGDKTFDGGLYRGPDPIGQVYGTRLKPLNNNPKLYPCPNRGRNKTPDHVRKRQIRTAGEQEFERDQGVVFRRAPDAFDTPTFNTQVTYLPYALPPQVIETWYNPGALVFGSRKV
eukprot:sb/3476611/